MNTLKSNLAAIREAAQMLPAGRRNQVLNRCDRISVLFKRQMEIDNRTPKDEQTAIAAQKSTNQRILAALMAGRKLSYLNRREFQTAEWHSRINEVKSIVAKRFPQYIFCSRWERGTNCNYKVYWLENVVL